MGRLRMRIRRGRCVEVAKGVRGVKILRVLEFSGLEFIVLNGLIGVLRL